ncbi:MAG: hypothetical protein COS95_06115 [Ignavibacteriales bacterium CG07_land_8_20_14_0_80_59_12]|nr:MAG: hypothetical protein COS95_06115 [Ignavibacteriales bacterium CG07_land_8_20_14_0_80_59_12]
MTRRYRRMPEDIITLLLGIQGFRVLSLEPVDFKGSRAVIVHLERVEKSYRCGECGRMVTQGYDSSWQEVRHLTFWQYGTILRFRRYRVNCPHCGIRTEALGFVEVRGPRVTTALSRLIYELCKVTTVKAVAMFFALASADGQENRQASPGDGAGRAALGRHHGAWRR